jgi:hypothetical protein
LTGTDLNISSLPKEERGEGEEEEDKEKKNV